MIDKELIEEEMACQQRAGEKTALEERLALGINYLAQAQHCDGSWTDFWLSVGTSDAWVSAYVGLALEYASRVEGIAESVGKLAAKCARKAGRWLLSMNRPLNGWGYNEMVTPDADSTAHVLSLLARLELKVPIDAIDFLHRHQVPAREGKSPGGRVQPGQYATYRFSDPQHQWTKPCADVTAACLRSFCDLGLLRGDDLQKQWNHALGDYQEDDGPWHGYWWLSPNYTTALVLEVWNLAGRPPLPKADDGISLQKMLEKALPISNEFDRACLILALCYAAGAVDPSSYVSNVVSKSPGDVFSADVRSAIELIDGHVRELLLRQSPDGGWPAAPILQVPPSHPRMGGGKEAVMAEDARRLFVTATAVKALATFINVSFSNPIHRPARVGTNSGRKSLSYRESLQPRRARVTTKWQPSASSIGQQAKRLRRLVELAADRMGLSENQCKRAGEVFSRLTARSLAEPSPWPSEQLSVLSMGSPLEFSAVVGPTRRPALRYAVEVGNPYLPPFPRAVSALDAIEETAAFLGYMEAWQRVVPALNQLISSDLAVPKSLRFWVWAGVDHGKVPILKVYANLLHREVPHSRARLERALHNLDMNLSPATRSIFDVLEEAGFVHELGFGLGPNGRLACKVYYELPGWERLLVQQVLCLTGISGDLTALNPQIPGVLDEALAAKSRAGIALRLDPLTGAVTEVTSASAFPAPMLSAQQTYKRVSAWITSQGWDGVDYRRLCALLMQTWTRSENPFPRVHSLVTRTLSNEASWSTLYIRPHIEKPIIDPQWFENH